jgi:hypothetical protein
MLVLILIFFVGCGVKGDPMIPNSDSPPSLLENYPDIQTDNKLDDAKKARR